MESFATVETDPIRYRNWLYEQVPKNEFEAMQSPTEPENSPLLLRAASATTRNEAYHLVVYPGSSSRPEETQTNSVPQAPKPGSLIMTRELGPKLLCFLVRDASGSFTCRSRSVRENMAGTGTEAEPNYVFLSYTRKQFCVATPAEIGGWKVPEEREQGLASYCPIDRAKLVQYGISAASKAKVPAFWLDFECFQPILADGETAENMADVYRIRDIVRIAQSVFIVRGPSLGGRQEPPNPMNKGRRLHEWGDRL